jgi:L,D-peptidoglycan transpeptidase YkuD (ErfK/YbiS/YcfS/YnhG family)
MTIDTIFVERPDLMRVGERELRCAIGANGFSNSTFEGSKTTPVGLYALRAGYYRPDIFLTAPQSSIPLSPIKPDDGWCDAPSHPRYNLPVKLPFDGSHERLWRDDKTYDIIIPIGYNDDPIVSGKGSAIFFHIAQPDFRPTLGCVAISLADMVALLPHISTNTKIKIG